MSKAPPKLLLEVTCEAGKLTIHGKLEDFKKRDTKDQKVLRAFLAGLAELTEAMDAGNSSRRGNGADVG